MHAYECIFSAVKMFSTRFVSLYGNKLKIMHAYECIFLI
jgi:hypothetical protein